MWFFSRKMQHLPEATGPFTPGCMDVMLDYDKEGIFMRLFYPTNEKKDDPIIHCGANDPIFLLEILQKMCHLYHSRSLIKKQSTYNKNSSCWCPWTPEPQNVYTQGMAKVLMIFPFFLQIARWFGIAEGVVPVIYGAKPKVTQKLKCIIMSHGLGGYRSFYSNLCCELASRGYLIASMEHRDHSASYTYFYQSRDDAENGIQTDVEYQPFAIGNKNHFQQRKTQVEYRAKECSKAVDFLIDLNKGKVPENVLDNVPTKRKIDFKLADLVGNLDLDNLVMSGHSFGGATALLTLSQRKELKCGILLDPWMYPIKDHKLDQKLEKEQPLLFINTQTFHIASNVDAMSKYLDHHHRVMYTILHTTHENQTDTVLLVGQWLNWFMKKLDPIVALKINSSLCIEFLEKHVGCSVDIDDCRNYLKEQKSNVEMGLTKAWA